MAAHAQVQLLNPPSEFCIVRLALERSSSPVEVPLENSIVIPVSAEFPQAIEPVLVPVTPLTPVELPSSRLQPKQNLPLDAADFTRAAGAQLPFDLALRYEPITAPYPDLPVAHDEQLVPGTILPMAAYPATEPDLSDCQVPALQPEIEAAAEWLPSELIADLKQPIGLSPIQGQAEFQIGFAVQENEPALPLAGGLKRPLLVKPLLPKSPALPEMLADAAAQNTPVSLPVQATESLRAPRIACFAGSIRRLFARPLAIAPRKLSLASAGEFPQPIPEILLSAQSQSSVAILNRTQGKCEPYENLFPHPESFLKSVVGNWAAADSLFAFNEPIPPKALIASVRRSTLSVLAKTFRASRQTGISVHPDPAIQPPVMREWQRPEKLALIRPRPQLRILPARTSNSALSALSPFSGASYQKSWEALTRRWHEAPNDLRWIAMVVPLIIGLIWFAKTPGAQDGAKGRLTSMIPNVSGLMNTSFSGDSFSEIKQNIQRRAAVELTDDFRQGLGDWAGLGDWSRGWTYDPAGFLRPRQLALYSPSLSLEDYRFEFLVAIERKALSWAFLAADVKNYYAARLEVTRGGPLQTVELVRYAVINGRPVRGSRFPYPCRFGRIRSTGFA